MKKAIILLLFGLSACVNSGVKVDPAKVEKFEVGKTSYTDVVTTLGRPTSESRTSTGEIFMSYSSFQAAARPETFIPLVGAFVGGADSHSSIVMFRFDQKQLLVSYTTNQTNVGAGNGIVSGSSPNTRVPDQPRSE